VSTAPRPPYPWYFFLGLPLIVFGAFDLLFYAVDGRLHGMNLAISIAGIVVGVVLNKVGYRVGRRRMEQALAERSEPQRDE
jgi:hypothetical protein